MCLRAAIDVLLVVAGLNADEGICLSGPPPTGSGNVAGEGKPCTIADQRLRAHMGKRMVADGIFQHLLLIPSVPMWCVRCDNAQILETIKVRITHHLQVTNRNLGFQGFCQGSLDLFDRVQGVVNCLVAHGMYVHVEVLFV